MGSRPPPAPLRAAEFLERAALRRDAPLEGWTPPLRFGIDLGTATIVLCALDAAGAPVYWDARSVAAVRDGVVVDFQAAVQAVRELARQAGQRLGVQVEQAGTAHPPGVPAADCQACRYVLEQADVACRLLTDEVSAAQALLGVSDGVVVDVGGGSTGVGVFRGGRLVQVSDRPGAGHHLDLILAGALRISIEEAEARKRLDGKAYLNILRAGIERIAESVRLQSREHAGLPVHLAGGALLIPGAAAIVERYLGGPVVAYPHAHLITPFGIALA